MLSCFNLRPDVTVADFRRRLDEFEAVLRAAALVEDVGPLGRRERDTILDTDDERNHEYYLIMTFRDKEQSDRAVEWISSHADPGEPEHTALFSLVADPVFLCWNEIA